MGATLTFFFWCVLQSWEISNILLFSAFSSRAQRLFIWNNATRPTAAWKLWRPFTRRRSGGDYWIGCRAWRACELRAPWRDRPPGTAPSPKPRHRRRNRTATSLCRCTRSKPRMNRVGQYDVASPRRAIFSPPPGPPSTKWPFRKFLHGVALSAGYDRTTPSHGSDGFCGLRWRDRKKRNRLELAFCNQYEWDCAKWHGFFEKNVGLQRLFLDSIEVDLYRKWVRFPVNPIWSIIILRSLFFNVLLNRCLKILPSKSSKSHTSTDVYIVFDTLLQFDEDIGSQ